MSRIGIFGGSFDPPHLGHQALCMMVLEAAPIDELWLVPTYRHFFGKALSDFDHRLAMCECMLRPFGERARVMEIEREMASEGRMLDTLQALQGRFPQHSYRLVIGADILQETHRWHRWDLVVDIAEPLVFKRHGFPGGDLPAPPEVSSTDLRARLASGQSIEHLVPRSVRAYIEAQGLYLGKSEEGAQQA